LEEGADVRNWNPLHVMGVWASTISVITTFFQIEDSAHPKLQRTWETGRKSFKRKLGPELNMGIKNRLIEMLTNNLKPWQSYVLGDYSNRLKL
jgi:hypothetical protein